MDSYYITNETSLLTIYIVANISLGLYMELIFFLFCFNTVCLLEIILLDLFKQSGTDIGFKFKAFCIHLIILIGLTIFQNGYLIKDTGQIVNVFICMLVSKILSIIISIINSRNRHNENSNNTIRESKGLIEKIENFEDNHKITVAIHKLLILIPSSMYVPPDLREASYQWMESTMNLEEEKRHRAGTKERVYRNTVYKINPRRGKLYSKPVYVVAEGATPLLTFFEVQKHSHPETDVYKKYSKDITKNFYNKLKELINDDLECRNLCELIYYDDYDGNGVLTNVAAVILQRLSDLCVLEVT
ncbi:stimulator of interferon genes protein homolog [Hylaeus anthracinus]|uniref:stimulator of interferon genes protein homolog n=1 Tax=Hylaeus anthracinus TaxID=313031 RepID=UPI0023BA3055|nr:stimulator of interferon genes protein homolog [Hylaeus anthracinus]